MKIFFYLFIVLWCGCSAKRKLKESQSASIHQALNLQRSSETKASAQLYRSDSSVQHTNQWLKLYPRGEIQLNAHGFVGVVDSLIWYGAGQQTHNRQLLTTSEDAQSFAEKLYQRESYVNRTEKKVLKKAGISVFWWLCAGILTMFAILFVYRKLRR